MGPPYLPAGMFQWSFSNIVYLSLYSPLQLHSFMILSFHVTPQIHLKINISFTSNLFSPSLVVAHAVSVVNFMLSALPAIVWQRYHRGSPLSLSRTRHQGHRYAVTVHRLRRQTGTSQYDSSNDGCVTVTVGNGPG